MATKKEKTDNKVEPTFTKEQFLKSKMFAEELDVVMICLKENEEYTIEQVKNAIDALKGGK